MKIDADIAPFLFEDLSAPTMENLRRKCALVDCVGLEVQGVGKMRIVKLRMKHHIIVVGGATLEDAVNSVFKTLQEVAIQCPNVRVIYA